MATPEELCFFHELYGCVRKKEKLQTGSESRIKTIISCSKQLSDNYHISLNSLRTEYPDNPSIRVHKSCVSRYTSPTNVRCHIAHLRKADNTGEENDHTPSKRKRLRTDDAFDFRKHCLFCPSITECVLSDEYDSRTPKAYRKEAYLIRSNTHKEGVEFKQYILDVCSNRNDKLGEIVQGRVIRAVGDLHAADARYH